MIRHITIFRKLSPVRSLLRWPDAYNNMAKIYHKMGRASDAYPMLQRFIELSDTIRKCRHTEEAIALQELYKHEQLSVENLYWRTRAAEGSVMCIG